MQSRFPAITIIENGDNVLFKISTMQSMAFASDDTSGTTNITIDFCVVPVTNVKCPYTDNHDETHGIIVAFRFSCYARLSNTSSSSSSSRSALHASCTHANYFKQIMDILLNKYAPILFDMACVANNRIHVDLTSPEIHLKRAMLTVMSTSMYKEVGNTIDRGTCQCKDIALKSGVVFLQKNDNYMHVWLLPLLLSVHPLVVVAYDVEKYEAYKSEVSVFYRQTVAELCKRVLSIYLMRGWISAHYVTFCKTMIDKYVVPAAIESHLANSNSLHKCSIKATEVLPPFDISSTQWLSAVSSIGTKTSSLYSVSSSSMRDIEPTVAAASKLSNDPTP